MRGIPSAHGKVYFNRIPLQGNIQKFQVASANYWQFRHGHVLNWYIELDGLKFMHVDSAEFFAKEWEGIEVDVLCLCAIGRNARPNYIEEAISIVKPKIVMACHWDCFWIPMSSQQQYTLPMVDLEGFIAMSKPVWMVNQWCYPKSVRQYQCRVQCHGKKQTRWAEPTLMFQRQKCLFTLLSLFPRFDQCWDVYPNRGSNFLIQTSEVCPRGISAVSRR